MVSDASNENDRAKNGRGREKMKAVQVVWKTVAVDLTADVH